MFNVGRAELVSNATTLIYEDRRPEGLKHGHVHSQRDNLGTTMLLSMCFYVHRMLLSLMPSHSFLP
jgi:hypothetical protein